MRRVKDWEDHSHRKIQVFWFQDFTIRYQIRQLKTTEQQTSGEEVQRKFKKTLKFKIKMEKV